MFDNWEYGKLMLEQRDIDSLDDWSDDKEFVYGILDEEFDYLWMDYNNEINGYHFIDKLYSCGIEDECVADKRKNNELELHFKTLDEAKQWIEDARKKKKYHENI